MNLVRGDITGGQRVFLANFSWRSIPAQLISLQQVQETTYEQVIIFLGGMWHRISLEHGDVLLHSECSICVVNMCKHAETLLNELLSLFIKCITESASYTN